MTAEPLKIAVISYYLPSGSKIGVGYQAHALANEFAGRGHAVTMFSACPPTDGARYEHVLVAPKGALRTFRFATQLARRDFRGFDVLHAWGDDYWIWRRRARAHVRTLPGSCFEEALRIRGLKERLRMFLLGLTEVLASLTADRAVVISPATRRWWPWVRTIVPCGVPIPSDLLGHPDREQATVLMVGTWRNRKRGALLGQEFVEHVLPRVPHAQLRIVASDVPEDFHPSVRGLGRISEAALADEYARATLFCLPSSYEGFGIPYVEAMAAGVPVVATPNVGARYVTDEGRAGVLVDDNRVGATIADLLQDTEQQESLRLKGRARAKAFALPLVADTYERLFRDTIARKNR